MQITDTAIANNGTDLLGSARISAQVGVAMADAGIAAWQSKYDYLLWRPQDAIRCGIAWGYANCDATWSSLIATPPHPDYVAGHPAFSTSAADLLQNFFGTGTSDDFCTSSDAYNNGPGNPIGAMTLCYNSFTAAADDATLSRIYGGIHTDIASNASALIGHQIASQILTNDFPVPEPGTLGLLGVGLAGAAALRRRRQAALWCTGSG